MEKNVAVGRRKAAVARVHMSKGKGKITINKRDYKVYFPLVHLQEKVEQPFKLTETLGNFDILVTIKGGGIKGQAEAIKLGIARALVKEDEAHRATLRTERLLTRDARKVERKKPGLRKARKKEQYSKR